MPDKKKTPALGCAGEFENVQLAGVNSFENSPSTTDKQADFAAHFLARRYRLSLPLARAIASLASIARRCG
jgi:hypothetical protein